LGATVKLWLGCNLKDGVSQAENTGTSVCCGGLERPPYFSAWLVLVGDVRVSKDGSFLKSKR
jgi:hypothetical protein